MSNESKHTPGWRAGLLPDFLGVVRRMVGTEIAMKTIKLLWFAFPGCLDRLIIVERGQIGLTVKDMKAFGWRRMK